MASEAQGAGPWRVQARSELDDYDRASITVDCVLLTVQRTQLMVVVHRRQHEPAFGSWALPGVFVNYPEREEDAVLRAFKTKTNLDAPISLSRLDWSSDPERDDRGWVVTHVYYGLACSQDLVSQLPASTTDVALVPVYLPEQQARAGGQAFTPLPAGGDGLAFDHSCLVALAVLRLRERLRGSAAALELVPEEFTLRELQDVYEAVLGERLSRATFQRMVLAEPSLVEPTGELEVGPVTRRRAQLYRPRS